MYIGTTFGCNSYTEFISFQNVTWKIVYLLEDCLLEAICLGSHDDYMNNFRTLNDILTKKLLASRIFVHRCDPHFISQFTRFRIVGTISQKVFLSIVNNI